MTILQNKAYEIYLTGQKTQKQIAEAVGVTERTIRTWIRSFAWRRLKEESLAAPALIAQKLSGQVLDLVNNISSREPGQRIPALHEAEVIRKLVGCIDKFKKYPTLAQTMQSIRCFISFIDQRDCELSSQVHMEFKAFMEQQAINGFIPNDMEYDIIPMATVPSRDPDEMERQTKEIEIEQEDIAGDISKYDEEMKNFYDRELPCVDLFKTAESLEANGFLTRQEVLPTQEKSGNILSYPLPDQETDTLTVPHIQTGIIKCSLPINCPITYEEAERYKHLLIDPVQSMNITIPFRERDVCLSWILYNIFQMYKPENERKFEWYEEIYKHTFSARSNALKIRYFFSQQESKC